jgi:hypothetical protein
VSAQPDHGGVATVSGRETGRRITERFRLEFRVPAGLPGPTSNPASPNVRYAM